MSNLGTRAQWEDKPERLKDRGDRGFIELDVREKGAVGVYANDGRLEGWEQEWS